MYHAFGLLIQRVSPPSNLQIRPGQRVTALMQHPRPAATRRPATHTLRWNQGIRHVAARMSCARLFGGSPMAHILVLRATEKQCTTHARARGAGAV